MQNGLWVIMVLLLVALCASPVWAAPSVTAEMDVFSAYIWRGFNLCNHVVWQPSVTYADGAWAMNVWSNLDGGDGGRCTELDYTLSHDFQLGSTEVTASYLYYTFLTLDEGARSQEVLLEASWPTPTPVNLCVSYDYDEGDGLYAELGVELPISREKELGAVALALGYNDHQWREESGLSHVAATYSLPVSTGRWTITPVAGYSVALADDFDNECYYGLQTSAEY